MLIISWFIRKVPDSRCWAWKQHPHPPSVFPPHKPHCSFFQCTAAIFDQGCNVAVSVIDGCILLICWNKASCGEMCHKPSYPKLQPFKAKPLRLNAPASPWWSLSPNSPGDKDIDDYYARKHHPDFGGRGPTHMVKLNAEPQQHQQHQQRQRPRRVQRAMSQDHVLSPPRTPRRGEYGLSSYGVMAAAAYGSSRHLSEEQLLSADRLHSQDPLLLSPAMRRDKFREKAMARAMSHADMLIPTTPVMDRHKVTKMYSQPSASTDSYNTLTVNHQVTTSKRQAFASRRTHTVDHLQYIPGHHHTYHTASKNEVTV